MRMKEWWQDHQERWQERQPEPDFMEEMWEWYRGLADLELQAAKFQDEWKEYERLTNEEQ